MASLRKPQKRILNLRRSPILVAKLESINIGETLLHVEGVGRLINAYWSLQQSLLRPELSLYLRSRVD